MVDGGASVVMVMKISSESPSRQGARTEFPGSESRFLMVAAQRKSIWEKRRLPDLKSSGGICRREGRPSGRLEPPHIGVTRPGLGRAAPV